MCTRDTRTRERGDEQAGGDPSVTTAVSRSSPATRAGADPVNAAA